MSRDEGRVILSCSAASARSSLEREAALRMLDEELAGYRGLDLRGARINGDKNDCTKEFLVALEERDSVPDISVRKNLKEKRVP